MTTEPDKPWSDEQLKQRGVGYKDKALWVVNYPYELSGGDLRRMALGVAAVWEGAERITEAFARDERLQSLFDYGPLQTQCILKDPGYRPSIPLGRMDAFMVGGEPRFMEFNTDGTAGWHYASALTALWREHEGLAPASPSLDDRLLATILDCYHHWSGARRDPPRIAIVDWDSVGTLPEQRALVSAFSAAGVPASLEDPRGLRLASGRLQGSAGPIDVVYRRLVSEEAFARAGEIRPFLDAYLSDAACFVGGFRTDPAWSKLLFVVLSDPAYADLFPPRLKADLDRYVPWTRTLAEAAVEYEGARTDLLRLLLDRQEEFIVKPARSYEGRGLLAGPYCAREVWEEGIRKRLETGGYVVQAFLRPDSTEVPGLGRSFVQPGAYVLKGRLAGFLPRISPTELIMPGVSEYYCPVGVDVPWPDA